MEWVESTGESVELAKEQALDRLGVHEDDAEFDVLSDVRTGVFGRIKEPARVRARVRPATPRSKENRNRRDRGNRRGRQGSGQGAGSRNGGGRKQDAGRGRTGRPQDLRGAEPAEKVSGDRSPKKAAEGRPPADRPDKKSKKPNNPRKKAETVDDDQEMMPLPQQADLAEEFVQGLAERFGASVVFQRENIGTDEIRITVSGDDLGRMVGHRGATAGAVDDLVRTFLQRRAGSARNGRIRVDVGGVIARRNAALVRFAHDQAAEVRSSGVPRSLEPMNAADRKVVHDAVDGTEGVRTLSEGEDPRRYVVIAPAPD